MSPRSRGPPLALQPSLRIAQTTSTIFLENVKNEKLNPP